MLKPRPRLLIASLTLLAAAALACGDGLALPQTPTPSGSDVVITPLPSPTPTPEPATPGSATATPAATLPAAQSPEVGTPTPVPPAPPAETAEATQAPLPPQSVTVQPAELVQGGSAVVYLNESATAATVTFGGRQYPMLQSSGRWWAMIGIGAFAEPGLAPLSIVYQPADGGDEAAVTHSIPIVDREFPVEHIQLDSETASLLTQEAVEEELAIRAAIYAGYTTERLWSGAFVRPSDAVISSRYGHGRSYNNGPVTNYHHGTDFAGAIGDPVYAAADGEVVFAEELTIRGNTIVVDHGAGVFTAYHHLSEFNATQGDIVSPGDHIGAIGSTGLVTGPHLHWEVVIRGVEVDGELWLTGDEVGP